jgi:hypothetical protein
MEEHGQILYPSALQAHSIKTSRSAIASLILGVLGFVIPVILSLSGLILGIVGLIHIKKGSGQITGQGVAIAGIAVSCITLVWSILIVLLLLYCLVLPVVISP